MAVVKPKNKVVLKAHVKTKTVLRTSLFGLLFTLLMYITLGAFSGYLDEKYGTTTIGFFQHVVPSWVDKAQIIATILAIIIDVFVIRYVYRSSYKRYANLK